MMSIAKERERSLNMYLKAYDRVRTASRGWRSYRTHLIQGFPAHCQTDSCTRERDRANRSTYLANWWSIGNRSVIRTYSETNFNWDSKTPLGKDSRALSARFLLEERERLEKSAPPWKCRRHLLCICCEIVATYNSVRSFNSSKIEPSSDARPQASKSLQTEPKTKR